MIETEQHPVVDGRYVLVERLSSSGAAEVYRARDRLLEREIALKILRKESAEDQECAERFRDEARSAAPLSHPNILQIYELGVTETGRPFVVMEYVRGGTLAHALRESGVLEPEVAVEKAARVSNALEAAHARGVFHRGVTPQDVLLTESGEVKVKGFGVGVGASADTSTEVPEGATDSPGVVLYEMLTGVPPLSGASGSSSMSGHVDGTPRPPRELNPRVPEEVSDLTLRLLAASPAERPADAALLEELERASDPPPAKHPAPDAGPARIYRAGRHLLSVSAKRRRGYRQEAPDDASPVPPVEPGRSRHRRKRRGRSLAAVSLCLVLAAAGMMLYGGDLRSVYPEAPSQANIFPSPPTPDGEAGGEAAQDQAAPDQVLVHTAEAEDISDNSTYLDIPAANGNPEAVISATQNWNPGEESGTYNDHPIGVWYDSGRERWAIFNQDRAEMPEGASFNLLVWSAPSRDE